jgi:hypothetical protein
VLLTIGGLLKQVWEVHALSYLIYKNKKKYRAHILDDHNRPLCNLELLRSGGTVIKDLDGRKVCRICKNIQDSDQNDETINFGMYKGRKYEDVPVGYLYYLLNNTKKKSRFHKKIREIIRNKS